MRYRHGSKSQFFFSILDFHVSLKMLRFHISKFSLIAYDIYQHDGDLRRGLVPDAANKVGQMCNEKSVTFYI